MDAIPVEKLKNIGPKSAQWMREIGLETRADLEEMGVVMAYHIMRHRIKGINVLMLYALEGALTDTHWNALPPARKAALQAASKEDITITFGRPGDEDPR